MPKRKKSGKLALYELLTFVPFLCAARNELGSFMFVFLFATGVVLFISLSRRKSRTIILNQSIFMNLVSFFLMTTIVAGITGIIILSGNLFLKLFLGILIIILGWFVHRIYRLYL